MDRKTQQENFRWAKGQVSRLMSGGRYKDAVELLLQIINHVSVDGQIDSLSDKTFVAIQLSECFLYINKNHKRYPQLPSLLNDLTDQIYANANCDIDLKRYILYQQHIGSFRLNPNKHTQHKRNSTFTYVSYSSAYFTTKTCTYKKSNNKTSY